MGNFVVDEILREIAQGKSPVSKEGRFKRLSKTYAIDKKGGDRSANLDLEGDMLNALTFKNTTDGVEIGIFKSSEVGKADGHNNHSGKSELPRRRFIPDDEQKFKQFIERGVKRIVRDYEREPTPRNDRGVEFTPTASVTTTDTTAVTIDDLFSDDFIGGLLGES